MIGNFTGIKPGFYIYAGNMCGGKTARLILDLKSISYANKKIQVFKTSWDNRYEDGFITANDESLKFPAKSVSKLENLIKELNPKTTILGIDELQFWDDNIIEFIKNYKDKMRIVSTCLLKDFRGNNFPLRSKKGINYDSNKTTKDLIEIAQKDSLNNKGGIIYLEPICLHKTRNKICGNPAPYIQRWNSNNILSKYSEDTIKIGVAEQTNTQGERYAPRCKKHFVFPKK